MTVENLEAEIRALPPSERRRLAAFLVALRHGEMEGFRRRMAEKIDHEDAGRWLTLDDLDPRIED